MVNPKQYGVGSIDESLMNVANVDEIFTLDIFQELNTKLEETMERWKITGLRCASILWRRDISAPDNRIYYVIRTKAIISGINKMNQFVVFDTDINDIQQWPTEEVMTRLLLLSQSNPA